MEKELLSVIENAIAEISYPSEPKCLFDPIRYILSLGGKRIRPVLALMANALYTDDLTDSIKPAIGIEVFHNFTLLHDDLMDNADMRRGKPTVHIKWDANTAILSGDAMQIMAYKLIGETPSTYLKEVLNLFSETALEICEGQQYDMEFESRDNVSESEYIEMIRLKTAVLIGCALKTGAIIGGADKEDADNLYTFGENIGLAFQLKDDLLDVFGDPEVFGKNIGGDICNNKKTYLLINALNGATKAQRAILDCWLDKKQFDSKQKIETFTNIYTESGAKEKCENEMNKYFQLGLTALSNVKVSEDKKSNLKKLATELMHREK